MLSHSVRADSRRSRRLSEAACGGRSCLLARRHTVSPQLRRRGRVSGPGRPRGLALAPPLDVREGPRSAGDDAREPPVPIVRQRGDAVDTVAVQPAGVIPLSPLSSGRTGLGVPLPTATSGGAKVRHLVGLVIVSSPTLAPALLSLGRPQGRVPPNGEERGDRSGHGSTLQWCARAQRRPNGRCSARRDARARGSPLR